MLYSQVFPKIFASSLFIFNLFCFDYKLFILFLPYQSCKFIVFLVYLELNLFLLFV